jgi:DNA-binding NarL/FixJ family response regulator
MLGEAFRAGMVSGETSRLVPPGRIADGLGVEDEGDRLVATYLRAGTMVFGGDPEHGIPLLREFLTAAIARDATDMYLVHSAAVYLGDEERAGDLLRRGVERARVQGAIGVLPALLDLAGYRDLIAGRIAAATATLEEGLRLAEETGQRNPLLRNLAVLAIAEAVAGREEDAHAHATEALGAALARGLGMAASFATWALALTDLGAGRPLDAAIRLEAHLVPGAGARHPVIAIWTIPDLVEAAVRAGRPETGRAALDVLERHVETAEVPLLLAHAARCRGLLASGAASEAHHAEAIRRYTEVGQPFDAARTRLLLGETLRRERRRTEAREHLRAAADALEALGAEPWAERARAELRATGEQIRRRDPSAVEQLTPQELQIARFVARGASNREVAAQLFLSHRTVGYHLQKVFRKLGVSTRAELIRMDLQQDP